MRDSSALGASSNSRCASSKKNTNFGLSRSPTSGSDLEQFRQQPEQEGRVEARALHQPVGRQDVDGTETRRIAAHHVGERQGRLAEELLAALLAEGQELALDGADRLLADIAEFGGEGAGILGDPLQQRLQVA